MFQTVAFGLHPLAPALFMLNRKEVMNHTHSFVVVVSVQVQIGPLCLCLYLTHSHVLPPLSVENHRGSERHETAELCQFLSDGSCYVA